MTNKQNESSEWLNLVAMIKSRLSFAHDRFLDINVRIGKIFNSALKRGDERKMEILRGKIEKM